MTADYPTLAIRPRYSVLDRSFTLEQLGVIATDWRIELNKVIEQISKIWEGYSVRNNLLVTGALGL